MRLRVPSGAPGLWSFGPRATTRYMGPTFDVPMNGLCVNVISLDINYYYLEYRDACKIKTWKYSLLGKNRYSCSDEVCVTTPPFVIKNVSTSTTTPPSLVANAYRYELLSTGAGAGLYG